MRTFVVLAAVLLAVAFAAPTPPAWPANFAATVFSSGSDGSHNFFRWFYSQGLNKDRFDTWLTWQGEQTFAKRIYDHATEFEYRVYYRPNLVDCYYFPVNGTVPHPNFAEFKFIGESLLHEVVANHWIHSDTSRNHVFQYYENAKTREPLRLDFDDNARRHSEVFVFGEFDESAQDPSLYTLPTEITQACNKVNPPAAVMGAEHMKAGKIHH